MQTVTFLVTSDLSAPGATGRRMRGLEERESRRAGAVARSYPVFPPEDLAVAGNDLARLALEVETAVDQEARAITHALRIRRLGR